MKKIIIVLLCFITINSYASPQRIDVKEQYDRCTTDLVRQLLCLGYFNGIIDGLGIVYNLKKDLSVGTLNELFIKEIKDHPEYRDQNADEMIFTMLKKYNYFD